MTVLRPHSVFDLHPAPPPGGRVGMLSWGEVPEAARSAILAEILRDVLELEIMESDEQGPRGQLIYDVEYECGDMEVEMEVTANGRVLEQDVLRAGDEEDEDEGMRSRDDDDDDDHKGRGDDD
jgi:hypothetical protein